MKSHIFTLLKFLIGWPLSIIALFFVIKLIAPQAPQFFSQLDKVSPLLLTCAMISFLIYFFLRGYIWKRLVHQEGYKLSYKDTNFIWAASELKRYIPGNIWSFVGRTVMLSDKGITKRDIFRCTLFEVEFLTLGAALASLLAIPFLSHFLQTPAYLTNLAILIMFVGIGLFAFHRKFKINLFFLPDYPPFEIIFLIVLNALLFFFFGLGYVFTFASFTFIDPNLVWQLTGVSILAYLIGYLSLLTSSGFGVREGALVFALAKIMPAATAGFVSLFGRFILMVAEVLYVVLSYIWDKTKHKWLDKIEHWIDHHKHLALLTFSFVLYTVYFTIVSSLRYDNLYTGKFDLGNMSQTVWQTTQGSIFTLTNPNGTEIISRLGVHADFLLILLAPFYVLWPDPRNILFFQSAAIAAGAFFVYLIAREVLKSKHLALVLSFVYLINPSIQRSNLYDFHAVTFATTFLLGAFYFFIKKQYKPFLIFAILAGICKEQIWLIIGMFGPFLFFWHKKYLAGILLFVISTVLSFFLVMKAIPTALGSQHFALEYFSEFGSGPLDIVKTIIFSPDKTLQTILEPSRIDYLRQLFFPLGYLSLLAPVFLIFAIPDLLINLLSNNKQLHQIYYQYTATISPFLFISAIYGIVILKKVLGKIKNKALLHWSSGIIIIYLIITSLYTAYAFGPLPGSRDANIDMITKPLQDKQFIYQELTTIPQEAKVAASNNIASHLTSRFYLFILPIGIEEADYVVFYLTPSQPAESLKIDRELVAQLKADPKFELIIEKGMLLIFKNVYH